MDPGSHGSTYGGNPLGTAVGLAVLREVVSQGLPERARRLGAEIRREMESWNLPVVQGVRGLGLLLVIGLNPEMVAAPEGKTIASVVVEALRQELGLSATAFKYAVMAASGVENKDICRLFSVSEDSVKSSLKRTFAAPGVKNRRGLIGKIPTIK